MSGNTRHVINMANSIVGVSILSMPYCFKEAGLILATVLVLFSGLLTKKTSMYLIRSAIMSRRRSFELLAFQVFGVAGKLFMELCLIFFLVGICISFHVVMGDLAPSIVASYMNIENTSSLRSTILCGIVLLVILPLCLLRNIDSLASMSACSIGFYVFLNSIVFYAALPRLLDGTWLAGVKLWEVKKAFHVLPIMSLALSCQSNVFEIYDSLPDPDVVKMKWVVNQAVNLCCALYIGVGFLGYIAFADVGIGGNVIMSFPNSGLTDGIKMLFVISLAISFPLMMFPCRTSIHSLFYRSVSQVSYTDLVGNFMPEVRFRIITFVILIFSLILGILLPNIEFVLGLLGSTMGMLIAIILPSIFFIKVYTKTSADRLLAQGLLLFGLFIMVTGTFIHLHSMGAKSDVLVVKTPIHTLSEDAVKIVPVVLENDGIPVGKLPLGRKEPAIPLPPKAPLPEIKELPAIIPKPEASVVKKAVPEIAAKPVLEGLHPDAIKHEEKEKAIEDKGQEVIEEKQEKILNYIEEQQKKQDEMLEILHELKDKTDKKVTGNVANLKAGNINVNDPVKISNVNAHDQVKVGNININDQVKVGNINSNDQVKVGNIDVNDQDKASNINVPDQVSPKVVKDVKLQGSQLLVNNVVKPKKKVIPLENKSNLDNLQLDMKLPPAEIQSNTSDIRMAGPTKTDQVVKNKPLVIGSKAPIPILNKSNKHDEERKKRDLMAVENEAMSKLNNNLIRGQNIAVFPSHTDKKTRRLLWTDFKVRRRKKQQNGDEYLDEI